MDLYDVTKYSNEELYELVGFPIGYSEPTTLELEAKIIAMIRQNMKVKGVTGKRMFLFFQDVYKHFFDHEADEKVNEEEKKEEKKEENFPNSPVQQTQTVSFTQGTLNPILKETYVRTISIDSQYRDAEYESSTDFTMNFTETLKDVVSMKLYAVQIPYTWYTISNRYGSNYFFFKPNKDIVENSGIFEDDYKVSIDPGNYTATSLTTAINTSVSLLGTIYTDVSFGETRVSYNQTNCKTTMTVDIQKVYNEAYYDINMTDQLASAFGLTTTKMYSVFSNIYATSIYTNTSSEKKVDASNNYFEIIQFNSWNDETPMQIIKVFIKNSTTKETISDGLYTASALLGHIHYTLQNNEYLYNSSIVEEVFLEEKFRICLNIRLNRFKTINQIHCKIKVRFPSEIEWVTLRKEIWINESSFFQFPSTEMYFSQIYSKNIVVFPVIINSTQYISFTPNRGISDHPNNRIRIQIGSETYANSESILSTINEALTANEITRGSVFTFTTKGEVEIKININKVYTTKDYKLVFYDTEGFTSCSKRSGHKNATIDNTLGWILGYRALVEYAFLEANKIEGATETEFINPDTLLTTRSAYTFLTQPLLKRDIVELRGDTVLSIYLYNYFMIILDDYNQNHLNDGLVTIARRDSSVTLPNYANRSKYQCDPVTGEFIHTQNALTQKQMYSVQQIINTQNRNRGNVTSGPFIKDMFAVLPVKTNSEPGTIYVEFGGTLQVQERIYFGPVNIHRMSIKLINDKGDIVDLNGANWSIQLTCQQLYQRTS